MVQPASTSPQIDRSAKRPGSGWLTFAGVIALVVLLPIAGLLLEAAKGSSGLWSHLFSTILPAAMADTVILLAGVGLVTAVIGTTTISRAGACWNGRCCCRLPCRPIS